MDSSRSPLIPLPPDVIARADPALLALLALQQARIEFLEARIEELLAQLGKKSSNSDKPPSSDVPCADINYDIINKTRNNQYGRLPDHADASWMFTKYIQRLVKDLR